MPSTVWKGSIAFGLVSIPVRLYRAARRERIRFRTVHKESVDLQTPTEQDAEEPESAPIISPVRTAFVSEAAETVRKADILKAYQPTHRKEEPQEYVTFRPEEIRAVRAETSRSVEIEQFVRLNEIDPIFFDASYYVAPDPAGEKAYAVLYESLRRAGYAGLGRMAMHGREHAVVIRPGSRGLLFETLFFQNEVHAADEFSADTGKATAAELRVAQTFIEALAAPFDAAQLQDRQEERLRELIESRREHLSREAPSPKTVDIVEALSRSLSRLKKKPAQAVVPPKRKRARQAS